MKQHKQQWDDMMRVWHLPIEMWEAAFTAWYSFALQYAAILNEQQPKAKLREGTSNVYDVPQWHNQNRKTG